MRRDSVHRAARVLCLALALAGSSACTVTTFLTGSEKRESYELDGNLKVSDPAFRRSAEALGNPMVAGNSATILENGDDIFPAMVRDILQAKKSVNLETYIFQPDRANPTFVVNDTSTPMGEASKPRSTGAPVGISPCNLASTSASGRPHV
jgi:hypothetical protein